MAGPCNWPVSYEECGACDPQEFFTETAQATFEAMATEYLWNWTGRTLGTCPVTVRPCRVDCSETTTFWGRGPWPGGSTGGWLPVLLDGQWYNIRCGTCAGVCNCDGSTISLRLPGPVATVDSVTIDGTVLDPTAYRVDNQSYLVRQDGGTWPLCQDVSLASGQVGTWEVAYQRGIEVPVGGQVAAGILALELAKAACMDNTCRLPQRIQSITRQGVTVAVLDAFEDVEKGRTGIWLIDSWVASITKPRRQSRVYSPDVPRVRASTFANATMATSTGEGGAVGGGG